MPKSAIEEAIIAWRSKEEGYIRSLQKTLLPGMWSYIASDSAMLENLKKSVIVKSVIRNRSDLNAKDQYGLLTYLASDSALLEHLEKYGGIKSLVRNYPDLNAKDQYGMTLLHYAVLDENIDIMMALLDNGANINIENSDKRTPLDLAFVNRKKESIEYLIEREADFDFEICDNEGNYLGTPLHIAIEQGDFAALQLFLSPKIVACFYYNDHHDYYNWWNKNGQTPLHLAVWNGCVESVKNLLDSYVDPMVLDKHDDTPLHDAARRGHLEIAQLLLDAGAVVDAINETGETPLDLASQSNQSEMVEYLMRYTSRNARHRQTCKERSA
jgi:ankyrin repeat protein